MSSRPEVDKRINMNKNSEEMNVMLTFERDGFPPVMAKSQECPRNAFSKSLSTRDGEIMQVHNVKSASDKRQPSKLPHGDFNFGNNDTLNRFLAKTHTALCKQYRKAPELAWKHLNNFRTLKENLKRWSELDSDPLPEDHLYLQGRKETKLLEFPSTGSSKSESFSKGIEKRKARNRMVGQRRVNKHTQMLRLEVENRNLKKENERLLNLGAFLLFKIAPEQS